MSCGWRQVCLMRDYEERLSQEREEAHHRESLLREQISAMESASRDDYREVKDEMQATHLATPPPSAVNAVADLTWIGS